MHTFESEFTKGDRVVVVFPGNAILKDCEVTRVSFTGYEGDQALYDVMVPYKYYDNPQHDGEPKTGYRRMHGLDNWFLRRPEWLEGMRTADNIEPEWYRD